MQKRFLYIAIRKYDFVEKRAGKRASGIQKSARAEARKAREPKSEKRESRNQKSARAEARKAREPKKEKP